MKSTSATLYFSELLLALLKGKATLLDALNILSGEGIEKRIRDSAISILAKMKKGISFSDSLNSVQHGKVSFEPLYLTLISAAELTGNIEQVLQRIVIDLQRREKAKGNALNILIYPAIVVFIALAGTIVLIAKGIPFFASGGLLSAAVVNDAKTGIAAAGMVLLVSGGGLLICYFKIFNNDSSESKIFYLLDFLLKSNVTLVDALSHCIMSLGQTKFGRALVIIKKEIVSGKSFAGAFANTNCFSAYVLGWLSIAATKGSLNEICGYIKEHYEQKDSKKRDAMAKLIEPAVIVIVGLYVLIIMMTVILPIISYAGGIL